MSKKWSKSGFLPKIALFLVILCVIFLIRFRVFKAREKSMISVKKVLKKGQKRVKKGSKKGQKWPILGHFWGPFLTYFWVNEAWEKSMILVKKVTKKVTKNHFFNTFLTLF